MAAPTVSSVSPATGPTTGGTPVTVTGTNLTGTTAVTFGGTPATSVTVNSSTQVTATSPAHAAGGTQVVVTTPGGSSSQFVFFTYLTTTPQTATITDLSPSTGPTAGGTPVTVTGTNLTGTTAVTFGGTPATSVTVNSSTQVTATSPAHAAGAVSIAVLTPAGSSNVVQFFYIAAPTINSLSPVIGPQTGGNTVTITGTNLAPVTTVRFDLVPASFNVTDSNQILAIAPAVSAGTAFVRVVVISAGGASNNIFYNYAPLPTVTDLLPDLGPAAGGNQIIIKGNNLGFVSTVSFGVSPASFAALSNSQVVATAPSGTGITHVAITTPGGASTGLTYTYVPPP